MSAAFARGTRRRFVSARAGTYPAPVPPAAAPPDRRDGTPFARVPEPDPFENSLFEDGGISFSAEVPRPEPAWAAAPSAAEAPFEPFDSSAFSTSEPGPDAAPARRRRGGAGPTARATVGILAGAAVGAAIGLVLSTAMLALYAPSDFAQAILDPVGLWTQIEDWKVLAGALLIAIGFAVLGAGQGSQGRAPRA
ncbi:MAG: hypothetical protein MUF27_03100 [Acidobacteria bacterium]|nr:hypothetical protein [Acidobacteriota bacterium]